MLKAILASLAGFGSDRTVMDAAFAVAQIDQGHIEALHTRIDAAELAASAMATTSHHQVDVREMAQNIAREEQKRSGSAAKAYSDACERHSLSQGADAGGRRA